MISPDIKSYSESSGSGSLNALQPTTIGPPSGLNLGAFVPPEGISEVPDGSRGDIQAETTRESGLRETKTATDDLERAEGTQEPEPPANDDVIYHGLRLGPSNPNSHNIPLLPSPPASDSASKDVMGQAPSDPLLALLRPSPLQRRVQQRLPPLLPVLSQSQSSSSLPGLGTVPADLAPHACSPSSDQPEHSLSSSQPTHDDTAHECPVALAASGVCDSAPEQENSHREEPEIEGGNDSSRFWQPSRVADHEEEELVGHRHQLQGDVRQSLDSKFQQIETPVVVQSVTTLPTSLVQALLLSTAQGEDTVMKSPSSTMTALACASTVSTPTGHPITAATPSAVVVGMLGDRREQGSSRSNTASTEQDTPRILESDAAKAPGDPAGMPEDVYQLVSFKEPVGDTRDEQHGGVVSKTEKTDACVQQYEKEETPVPAAGDDSALSEDSVDERGEAEEPIAAPPLLPGPFTDLSASTASLLSVPTDAGALSLQPLEAFGGPMSRVRLPALGLKGEEVLSPSPSPPATAAEPVLGNSAPDSAKRVSASSPAPEGLPRTPSARPRDGSTTVPSVDELEETVTRPDQTTTRDRDSSRRSTATSGGAPSHDVASSSRTESLEEEGTKRKPPPSVPSVEEQETKEEKGATQKSGLASVFSSSDVHSAVAATLSKSSEGVAVTAKENEAEYFARAFANDPPFDEMQDGPAVHLPVQARLIEEDSEEALRAPCPSLAVTEAIPNDDDLHGSVERPATPRDPSLSSAPPPSKLDGKGEKECEKRGNGPMSHEDSASLTPDSVNTESDWHTLAHSSSGPALGPEPSDADESTQSLPAPEVPATQAAEAAGKEEDSSWSTRSPPPVDELVVTAKDLISKRQDAVSPAALEGSFSSSNRGLEVRRLSSNLSLNGWTRKRQMNSRLGSLENLMEREEDAKSLAPLPGQVTSPFAADELQKGGFSPALRGSRGDDNDNDGDQNSNSFEGMDSEVQAVAEVTFRSEMAMSRFGRESLPQSSASSSGKKDLRARAGDLAGDRTASAPSPPSKGANGEPKVSYSEVDMSQGLHAAPRSMARGRSGSGTATASRKERRDEENGLLPIQVITGSLKIHCITFNMGNSPAPTSLPKALFPASYFCHSIIPLGPPRTAKAVPLVPTRSSRGPKGPSPGGDTAMAPFVTGEDGGLRNLPSRSRPADGVSSSIDSRHPVSKGRPTNYDLVAIVPHERFNRTEKGVIRMDLPDSSNSVPVSQWGPPHASGNYPQLTPGEGDVGPGFPPMGYRSPAPGWQNGHGLPPVLPHPANLTQLPHHLPPLGGFLSANFMGGPRNEHYDQHPQDVMRYGGPNAQYYPQLWRGEPPPFLPNPGHATSSGSGGEGFHGNGYHGGYSNAPGGFPLALPPVGSGASHSYGGNSSSPSTSNSTSGNSSTYRGMVAPPPQGMNSRSGSGKSNDDWSDNSVRVTDNGMGMGTANGMDYPYPNYPYPVPYPPGMLKPQPVAEGRVSFSGADDVQEQTHGKHQPAPPRKPRYSDTGRGPSDSGIGERKTSSSNSGRWGNASGQPESPDASEEHGHHHHRRSGNGEGKRRSHGGDAASSQLSGASSGDSKPREKLASAENMSGQAARSLSGQGKPHTKIGSMSLGNLRIPNSSSDTDLASPSEEEKQRLKTWRSINPENMGKSGGAKKGLENGTGSPGVSRLVAGPFRPVVTMGKSDGQKFLHVENNADIVLISTQESASIELWESSLLKGLGKQYVLFWSESLSAIRLVMFVRRELRTSVRDVKGNTISAGVGNVLGNKGGVGVSFRFCDAKMLVIGSHLAAHDEFVERRNADFRRICMGMALLGDKSEGAGGWIPSFETTSAFGGRVGMSLNLENKTMLLASRRDQQLVPTMVGSSSGANIGPGDSSNDRALEDAADRAVASVGREGALPRLRQAIGEAREHSPSPHASDNGGGVSSEENGLVEKIPSAYSRKIERLQTGLKTKEELTRLSRGSYNDYDEGLDEADASSANLRPATDPGSKDESDDAYTAADANAFPGRQTLPSLVPHHSQRGSSPTILDPAAEAREAGRSAAEKKKSAGGAPQQRKSPTGGRGAAAGRGHKDGGGRGASHVIARPLSPLKHDDTRVGGHGSSKNHSQRIGKNGAGATSTKPQHSSMKQRESGGGFFSKLNFFGIFSPFGKQGLFQANSSNWNDNDSDPSFQPAHVNNILGTLNTPGTTDTPAPAVLHQSAREREREREREAAKSKSGARFLREMFCRDTSAVAVANVTSALLPGASLPDFVEDSDVSLTSSTASVTAAAATAALNLPSPTAVLDAFDVVIWMGDLNYRVNSSVPVARTLLRRDMLEVLLANDQLRIQQRKGRTFPGFEEHPIHFPPTFKTLVGSDEYDFKRVPSWTDRVLWRCKTRAPQPSSDPRNRPLSLARLDLDHEDSGSGKRVSFIEDVEGHWKSNVAAASNRRVHSPPLLAGQGMTDLLRHSSDDINVLGVLKKKRKSNSNLAGLDGVDLDHPGEVSPGPNLYEEDEDEEIEEGVHVRPLYYVSVPEVRSSDHKPVVAGFELTGLTWRSRLRERDFRKRQQRKAEAAAAAARNVTNSFLSA